MTASLEKAIGRLLAGKRVTGARAPGHSRRRSQPVRVARQKRRRLYRSFVLPRDDRQACIEHVKVAARPGEARGSRRAGRCSAGARRQELRELADPFAPGW